MGWPTGWMTRVEGYEVSRVEVKTPGEEGLRS